MSLTSWMNDEMKLRNYSSHTIRNYSGAIKVLCQVFKKSPGFITHEELRKFLIDRLKSGASTSKTSMYIHSLNFLHKYLYRKGIFFKFSMPRRKKRIPDILSLDEINNLINSVKNPRHYLLLTLAYSAGLRVSELVNCRLGDFDLQGLQMKVRQGKGKKDRITIFSEKISGRLSRLVKCRPADSYLFITRNGSKMSVRTAQKIFKQALLRAGINKNLGIHSLRHSFATHLLEKGVDLAYIRDLLGHNSIQTTMIYTRVTNPALKKIKSPL